MLGQLWLAASSVMANPGILLGGTICDNQADAFDYVWITDNVQNTRLFFVSGNSVQNGAITAVGHKDAFDKSADVYIVLHGAINVVGDFSGTDFAKVFLANHPSTPTNVTMYVCQSGTPPLNGVSSMAALARSYPGNTQDSTLVTAMTAPGPNSCPALRASASDNPFVPINAIKDAAYRTGVQHTKAYAAALKALLDGWTDQNTPYPNTKQTYEDYCKDQLKKDATGQWVSGFIANVSKEFGAKYLALINTNYNGNALATCGTNVQCN